MTEIIVPSIKPQGIKTKLVPWINDLILTSGTELNVHPFFPSTNDTNVCQIRVIRWRKEGMRKFSYVTWRERNTVCTTGQKTLTLHGG